MISVTDLKEFFIHLETVIACKNVFINLKNWIFCADIRSSAQTPLEASMDFTIANFTLIG